MCSERECYGNRTDVVWKTLIWMGAETELLIFE